jgi:hypothetical protein
MSLKTEWTYLGKHKLSSWHYHYIREVIEPKFMEVFFINGDKNPADLLTKNLGSVKCLLFCPEYDLHFPKLDAYVHR